MKLTVFNRNFYLKAISIINITYYLLVMGFDNFPNWQRCREHADMTWPRCRAQFSESMRQKCLPNSLGWNFSVTGVGGPRYVCTGMRIGCVSPTTTWPSVSGILFCGDAVRWTIIIILPTRNHRKIDDNIFVSYALRAHELILIGFYC